MKKILAVTVFAFCAVLLFALPGCSSFEQKGTKNNGKSYAEIMNEKLVSFTDCANAFSDSLEKIADRTYAPSEKQTADIQSKLDRLEKTGKELVGLKAPAAYSEAQSALDAAMADYSDAFEKCRTLLAFYGTYDEMFRKYKDPKEGSAKIEKEERALYGDFAQAMEKATQSFRAACEKFDKVR